MPTSVHLPEALLDAIDNKAKALRISRNQMIIRALEREVREKSDWTPGFFERLTDADAELRAAVDTLVRDARKSRRSKAPPKL